MKTLLQINASLFANGGQSTRLADQFVAAWRANNPGATVIVRDLAVDAGPAPHRRTVRRVPGQTRGARRRAAGRGRVLRCADRRIEARRRDRLRAADVQLRRAVDAEGVFRPRRACRPHVQVHGDRAGRPADRQEGVRVRDARRHVRRHAARHADDLRSRLPALPRHRRRRVRLCGRPRHRARAQGSGAAGSAGRDRAPARQPVDAASPRDRLQLPSAAPIFGTLTRSPP